MGACVAKPKTVEGKSPEEAATISTPKVAPEPTVSTEVAADENIIEKVVEGANEEPVVAATVTELPDPNIDPKQEAVVTPKAIVEPEQTKEEVVEKIVEEEKPSTSTEVVEETSEVKKDIEEQEEKPSTPTEEKIAAKVVDGTLEVKKDVEEHEEKPAQS